MLKTIRTTNFKVIADSSNVPLRPLTVLIGRNASGKSSLVESLDWLGRAVDGGAEHATEPFRRIRDVINHWSLRSERAFSVSLSFDPQDTSAGDEVIYRVEVGSDDGGELPRIKEEEMKVKIRGDCVTVIRTDGETRQHRVNVSFAEPPSQRNSGRKLKSAEDDSAQGWISTTDPDRLALSSVDPVESAASTKLRRYLERAVFLRLNPSSIASFAPARSKASPRLLDEEGYRLAALLGEFDDEAIDILVERLSFIISGARSLESHRPTNPADRRYFTFVEGGGKRKKGMQIPAWVLSEGTRRITAIMAVLLHDDPPPLVCIEEVENGLDPWTVKLLLNELAGASERGVQIVLTSHSPYLLNLLPLESIVVCDRTETGAQFYPASDLKDLEAIRTRMETGDLYANRYLHGSKEKEKKAT